MKETLNLVILSLLATMICFGQEYEYQPWRPDMNMGSLNFNTLGDAQHPYAQCKYGSSYNNPTTVGINGSGNTASHAIITSNTPDPCRCYSMNGGESYIHESYMPPLWNMADYPNSHQDTVIRIGCGSINSICNKASQIEYWFYPEDSLSSLLVMFSFAIQNVNITHGVDMGCGSLRNPQFYIEVLDGETEQLLDLGYYPTKASQQSSNPEANTNWPYSRFLAWPSGCGANNDSQNPPDDYGITTYYWLGQNSYGYTTPTTFDYRECPGNQTSGNSSSYPVEWFEYKPLAFNLGAQAAQNVDANGNFTPVKSVKLRIHTYGCSATAHWAYGLFTAQMFPSVMQVTCCSQSLHLSVPAGFIPQTYEWHYGYDSIDAINNVWDLNSLPAGISSEGPNSISIDYDQANLYPYYRCEMKSYTSVPFIYEAYFAKEYRLEPDFSYEQDFNSDEVTIQFHDESLIYSITPGFCQETDTSYLNINLNHIRWYVKNGDHYQQFAVNNADPVHTFDTTVMDENGTISVKIIVDAIVDGTSCLDSIEKVIHLSLVEVPKHQFPIYLVYPNPTSNIFHVQCSMDDVKLMGGRMQLVDIHGNVLQDTPVIDEITEIDLSHYAGGVYFVKWVSEGNTLAVQKVVKQ